MPAIEGPPAGDLRTMTKEEFGAVYLKMQATLAASMKVARDDCPKATAANNKIADAYKTVIEERVRRDGGRSWVCSLVLPNPRLHNRRVVRGHCRVDENVLAKR